MPLFRGWLHIVPVIVSYFEWWRGSFLRILVPCCFRPVVVGAVCRHSKGARDFTFVVE